MADQWDRGLFESTLDEIEVYLADLEAIDQFIKAVRPNAIAARHSDSMSLLVKARLSVGKVLPFEMELVGAEVTKSGSRDGSAGPMIVGPEEQQRLAAEAEADYKETLNECYGDGRRYAAEIVEYVRSSAKDQIRPIAQTFQDAADTMRNNFDDLTTFASQDLLDLTNSVGDWEGDSADAFFDYTYGHIAPAAETHKYLSAALCYGLTEACSIVKCTQEALMSLVTAMPQALKQQLKARQSDWQAPPPPSTAEALGLLGAAIGVLAAIPTAGGSLSVIALAGAGVGMARTAASLSGVKQTKLSSSTATELASDFISHLTDDLYWNRQSWDRLDSMVTGVAPKVSADGSVLAPRAPDSGHMRPGDWHHESVNY